MEESSHLLVTRRDGGRSALPDGPRYRRCGWARAGLQLGSSSKNSLAAAKRGLLPGPRQTIIEQRCGPFTLLFKVRGEIYVIGPTLACLRLVVLNTDPTGRRRKGESARILSVLGRNFAGEEGGLTHSSGEPHGIGGGLAKRMIQARVAGNTLADELADQTAAERRLPDRRLGCYDWVRATAVRARE